MTQRRVTDTTPGVGTEHVDVTVENTGEGTVYRAEPRYTATRTVTDTPVFERRGVFTPPRDRLRWGPVLAGLVTTLASMLVLTVLGLAIGLSVFEPTSDGSDVGTAAAIWSALSALVSFLLGGWVAGKTAGVRGDDNALLNGFMVGASALALTLWLASMGVGNLLGGIGNNIDEIARVGRDQFAAVDTQATAQNAENTAVQAYDDARHGAWGTLAGMVLALGAAALGGLLGHRSQDHHTKRDDFDGDDNNGHR